MMNLFRKLKYFIRKILYLISSRLFWKLTIYGKGVLFIAFFSFLFIGYIKVTMIFEITIILSIYFINAVFFNLFFRTKLIVKRELPKYCTVDRNVTYTITIENKSKKWQRGLFLVDEATKPIPTMDEYLSTYITKGKKKRKKRPSWRWFLRINKLAEFQEFKIDDIAPGEIKEITVSFKPIKRGHIHLTGIDIIKKDPFSLIRSRNYYAVENNILALPKMYEITLPQISAHRKYNQGGISQALKVGNSEEFISLRDYQVGDVIKKIHWKSFAKTQKPVVKEFSDEFFSRYGLILDTFCENTHSEIFEDGVSIAASIISGIELGDSLIDLMFVGTNSYVFTNGRGLSNQEKMLEILASVRTCKEEKFELLLNIIKGHIALLSSLVIILIDIDDNRKKLLDLVSIFNIPIKIIVVGKNVKEVQKKIEKFEIKLPVTVVETGKIGNVVW